MTNNTIKKDLNASNSQKPRIKAPPKKFIFDFPEPSQNNSEDINHFSDSENLELETYIPLILGFDPPQDYQKAYESLCELIIKTFNEVHQLVFTEHGEKIPDIFELKFEEPKDCVRFLREALIRICKRFKKLESARNLNKDVKEYEDLLQKTELRVRNLIRNEQVYRISFDQFAYRHEETERTIVEIQNQLKEKKSQIEALTQEASKLASIIHSKDEEIRTRFGENPTYTITNSMTHPTQNSSITVDTSSLVSDQNKAKLKNLNLQNLKIVLKGDKERATPSESSRLTPGLDSHRAISGLKKSSRALSPTIQIKSFERSGKSIELTSSQVTKLSNVGREKTREMKSSMKGSNMQVLTERQNPENLVEKINNPEVNLENYSIHSALKGKSTQLYPPEQIKSKVSPPKMVRFESTKDEKSIKSARLRPYEDNDSAFIFKTESSDTNDAQSVTVVKTERRKKDTTPYQMQSKREYQLLNPREAKSGISKMRTVVTEYEADSQERSLDFKNMLLKNKQSGYGILNSKDVSKEKSVKKENKDGKTSPASQSNPVFMSIMLKKLAVQKSSAKKAW